MLKAGALYFAIVVAFLIAVITASLIMLAAHFRGAYLKEMRYNKLLNNMNSGVTYLLNDAGTSDLKLELDLFKEQTDSIMLQRKNWGIFDVAMVKSYIHGDTLSKAFLIGINTEKDLDVLYLSDEDRPISVSGKTQLIGNGALPKSGIKQSYAEGKPYTGDKKLIAGTTTFSTRTLKGLNKDIVSQVQKRMESDITGYPLLTRVTATISFKDSTQIFRLMPGTVINNQLEGNMILVSDSSVTVSATAVLNNIQIYAHSVTVETGFKGNCQIFARDSVVVGDDVTFNYPSAIGVLRTKGATDQPKISFGKGLLFNGIVFSYEDKRTPLQTLIGFEKESRLNGEVYATGMLKLEKGMFVAGKVSCTRFIMQTPATLYENFLIDVTFNRKARSKYYLSSRIFEGQTGERSVLKWLN